MKNDKETISMETINEDERNKRSKQSIEECALALSEKLEIANTLLTTILEITHEFIIFGLDTEYRYLSFNNRHKEMAKSQWGANIALGMKFLDLIDEYEERKNMKSFFDRVLSGEKFSSIEEYNDENGGIVLGKNHWAPIKNNRGEITGLVCFIQDATEKKKFLKEMLEERKNQDTIESLTFCDQLTGAYNRKFFEKELIRLDEKSYYPLSIILLNVNSRDQVNKQYGHTVGDVFIKKVAQILKNGCRGFDVVARLDGDEFVVIMPRTVGGKVERAIKRIKKSMDEVKINSITLSVSFGFSTKYEETEDINEIYESAKKQLERSKSLNYY
ncbi:diguanylate cyclase [Acetobacterium sp.]|uniref:sensor domain-containing diguanylate cyclase n=1 Tax=Acetobacterium sp. TaxID=1872094 RepID=UPI002F40E623